MAAEPLLLTPIVYVSRVPETATSLPSVLVIIASMPGLGPATLASVALLLAALRSVTPAGAVTVAVLVTVPVVPAGMLPVTTYVTLLPTGRLTVVSLMFPLPLAVKPVAPPVGVAV